MRTVILSFLACGLLVGCGPKTSSEPETATKVAQKSERKVAGKLEIQAFKGGYDIDFYQKSAEEFKSKHPELTEAKCDGNPRVWEQLRPRFVSGDVPDLVFPGWGMDHWKLAGDSALTDLSSVLEEKAYGSDKTWRETFDPRVLTLGQLDGKQYCLPFYLTLSGWWYDPAVFAAHGWTPPKTYDELLALCEKIKAAGIAPITFQGQYPYYMLNGMFIPWAISAGGAEVYEKAQNMEPGAWKDPAFLKAAQMIAEVGAKGYYQAGAVSMSHTESQNEFLQGKAAMIFCGTWLEAEMKKQMKPGQKLGFFLPPHLADGKGDANALQVGIEPWMIPEKAKNKDAAIEFFKYMTSLEKAKQFVTEKATLTGVIGSDAVEIPESLKAPAEAYKNAKTLWSTQYRDFYKDFEKEMENSLTSLLNGQLTPEQFLDRIEAKAESVRKDASLPKHKIR